jgi:hypothetical protein
LNIQSINVAIFDADSRSKTNSDRQRVLADLTNAARNGGYKIEKSALAFESGGRLTFYGAPDLVKYLSNGWTPHWTHWIDMP